MRLGVYKRIGNAIRVGGSQLMRDEKQYCISIP